MRETSIHTYPNPVSDKLFIELGNSEVNTENIYLMDIQGKLHDVKFNQNISRNQLVFDLKHLNSGIYLLQIEVNQTREVIKVIKQE